MISFVIDKNNLLLHSISRIFQHVDPGSHNVVVVVGLHRWADQHRCSFPTLHHWPTLTDLWNIKQRLWTYQEDILVPYNFTPEEQRHLNLQSACKLLLGNDSDSDSNILPVNHTLQGTLVLPKSRNLSTSSTPTFLSTHKGT